jgi:hypothetical protein
LARHEATYAPSPFNKEFLDRTRPFSAVRFMDWGATNGSPVVNWADRALVSDITYQTSNGVPIEVMIDLANRLQVDPWFCIPHKATDDYIRNFAALLRAKLDPALKPHIEYSNEVWNTGFSQTQWAIAESQRLGLELPWGTPSRFYAQRSVEMFKIMQAVYGVDSGRLVRVVSGQAVWTQFLVNALDWKDTAANTDVMAIAPYIYAESAADPGECRRDASTDERADRRPAVREPARLRHDRDTGARKLAAERGLKLKGYEGGQHLSADYFPTTRSMR